MLVSSNRRSITLSSRSMLALRSMRREAVSVCPFSAAQCNGLRWSCFQINIGLFVKVIWEKLLQNAFSYCLTITITMFTHPSFASMLAFCATRKDTASVCPIIAAMCNGVHGLPCVELDVGDNTKVV